MTTFRARLKEARKTNQPRLRFDLEKLRDPMAYTFQATMGGKFASLIGLRDEELDINTMIMASRQGESLPELIIYQQNLFKLTGRPS